MKIPCWHIDCEILTCVVQFLNRLVLELIIAFIFQAQEAMGDGLSKAVPTPLEQHLCAGSRHLHIQG